MLLIRYFAVMNKTILITGATSGIGKAAAIKFAAAGFNIIITGRRNERLIALKEKLESEFGVRILSLCFDVQDRKAVADAIAGLPANWQQIDILFNNAGLALGKDSFEDNVYTRAKSFFEN